jgi:hypothetical protein
MVMGRQTFFGNLLAAEKGEFDQAGGVVDEVMQSAEDWCNDAMLPSKAWAMVSIRSSCNSSPGNGSNNSGIVTPACFSLNQIAS